MTRPFFDLFPKVAYITSTPQPGNKGSFDILTNVLARTVVLKAIKNSALFYYTYSVKDSDTPEIIASKMYGDAGRHWIILMANDIVNPLYDWPLPYNEFIKFVSEKYDSLANSKTGTHHYQETISSYDAQSRTTSNTIYQIDAGVYANTPEYALVTTDLEDGTTVSITTTTQAVSNYDYEMEVNEAKRSIKIVRPDLVGQIEKELRQLLSTAVLA